MFWFQTDVTELCGNASGLAQQLTHVELERLSYIGPEEFVQAFAKENPHFETSFKDMKKTRNLESYVSWFNRLSYFVATEVVKVSLVVRYCTFVLCRFFKNSVRLEVFHYDIVYLFNAKP